MNEFFPQWNLVVAWLWVVLGVLSGLGLGLFFQNENWLGGYTSFKRRLYRLGHISFFGLGLLNFMFYLTASSSGIAQFSTNVAGWSFLVSALTMPTCCFLVAHRVGLRLCFAVPVLSLLFGSVQTLIAIMPF